MYKVFYSDRCIFLTDDPSLLEGHKVGKLLTHPDRDHLIQAIDGLFTDNNSEDWLIHCRPSELESMWEAFRSAFDCVEAAGGLVCNELNEWLMIFRKGIWDLPKGKIDTNEKAEKAAVREVAEETGLQNIKLISYQVTSFHVFVNKGNRILKPTHWYSMQASSHEKLKPQLEENITQIAWFPEKELIQHLQGSYRSLREVCGPILTPSIYA